jgi:mannose-6-phosphate isomerase-like protein (cupin superfamily)
MGNGARLFILVVSLLGVSCRRSQVVAEAQPTQGRESGAQARPQSYWAALADMARHNQDFRRVVFTGSRMQLVLMSIPPGGEIGQEMHARVEQALFCVAGSGVAILNGVQSRFAAGDAVIVTPGTRHNFRNTGQEALQLYTLYSPPNHIDGRVQHTQADAQADRQDEEFGRQVEGGVGAPK